MLSANYLKLVREQYESYPYPPRDPAHEKQRLIPVMCDCLDFLNHYYFAGLKDFSKDFEVLVAGGGTGDSIIFLAEQLRDTDARIVYLDLSLASMNIAKERAKIRNLNNIEWIHASILDIPNINIGQFDYINCTGVLHHLANPSKGLSALSSALKNNGTIGVMMYGKHGRTAIYQIQELMKLVNSDTNNMQEQIDLCKSILKELPAAHIFKQKYTNIAKNCDDIDIYDLFLHSQDKPYLVLDLYELAASSNLTIDSFFDFGQFGNNMYTPEKYIQDPNTLKRIKLKTKQEQQAIAESIHGNIAKHYLSMSKNTTNIANIQNLDYIPVLSLIIRSVLKTDAYQYLYNLVYKSDKVAHINFIQQIYSNKNIPPIILNKTQNIATIFKYIDGKRTIKQILKKAQKDSSSTTTQKILLLEFQTAFTQLNNYNMMFLKGKGVAECKLIPEMQETF